MVGVSSGLFLTSANARVEALKQAEQHALGMRKDALQSAFADTIEDLLVAASLTSMQEYLEAPDSSGQDLERELLALMAVHPEYEEAAVLLSDGRLGLHILGRAAQDETIADAGQGEEVFANLQSSRPWIDMAVFVAYGPEEEGGHHQEDDAEALHLSLLVGVQVRSPSGTPMGAVAVRLAWEPFLASYAAGHPDSQSIPALRINELPPLVLDDPHLHGTAEVAVHAGVARLPAETHDLMEAETEQGFVTGGLLTFATISLNADFLQPVLRSSSAGAPATPEITWKAISWVAPSTLSDIRSAGLPGLVGWNAFGFVALGLIAWFAGDRLARRKLLHRRLSAEHGLFSAALDRYLPKVGNGILVDPQRYNDLGGKSAEVAVLFADIRGFTSFAEARPPEQVVSALNRLLATLLPSLRAHGGTLDKYIGDGFLAFFDCSVDGADARRRAVSAAREMQANFLSLQRTSRGGSAAGLGLGIGISWGRVILGNVGTEEAMDFTVIGDTVNIAARLQALASAGEILVTDDVGEILDGEMLAERCVTLELRGRRTPVRAYVITEEDHTDAMPE